jgi:hypothetical protein
MKNTLSKIFDNCAKELCRRVGVIYPIETGEIIEPYHYEWTAEEEKDFMEWMKGYLKTIPYFKRMGVKYIDKEISWFIFQYGWKYKEKTNGN